MLTTPALNVMGWGGNGTASMDIVAGNTITVGNNMFVSTDYNPTQVGIVNMSGGTLTVGAVTGGAPWENCLVLGGNAGTGIMNQSGGTVTVGAQGVILGWWDQPDYSQKTIGIYNLDGGELDTPLIVQGSPYGVGKGYFNFNGGLLLRQRQHCDLHAGADTGLGEGRRRQDQHRRPHWHYWLRRDHCPSFAARS